MLGKVALRLLAAHSTSACTERSWTLWGRVCTSARTGLDLERAKKLIVFCFNDRCRVADQNDLHLLLETVENLLADESNEAAEEAVAGLHEAAVEAGGVAAAAASSAAVARGSDASPLAVIAEQEGDADGWWGLHCISSMSCVLVQPMLAAVQLYSAIHCDCTATRKLN
jgi:hypothetical protein